MNRPFPSALAAILLPLALTACSQPDAAQRDAANVAFDGMRGADGTLQPVPTRAVRIGLGGPRTPACRTTTINAATPVYWSPEGGPVKAQVSGEVAACDTADGFTGIVFAAPGQNFDACNIARPLRNAREYQGPCRWGWARLTGG